MIEKDIDIFRNTDSADSKEPVIPDQVLNKEEVGYKKALQVMAGCPGYEWLNEPSPPNWPPKKGFILDIRAILSEISFAIKYRHANKALRKLEKNL